MTGKRRQPARGGYRTKDDAEAGLLEFLATSSTGTWADDKRRTVGQWLENWLAECAERLEPKTVEDYASIVRAHLIPALGSIRLRDLQRHHVEAMLRDLARRQEPVVTRLDAVLAFVRKHPEGVRTRAVRARFGESAETYLRQLVRGGAVTKPERGVYVPTPPQDAPAGRRRPVVKPRQPRTLDGVRRVLRAALGVAVDRGYRSTNPAEGRMSVLPKIGRTTARCWEPEQVRAFLDFIADDRLMALWVVAAFTGLRRGELCGVRWCDVDLSGPTPGITVNQRVSCVSGEHPCPVCGGSHTGRQIRPRAKSDAGLRWVPLAPVAVREFLAHKASQEAERDAWGSDYSDHDLVFCRENGEPLRPDWVTHRHAALVAAAGLPKVVLHEMRHGAASLMAAGGMPLELIALVIGHGGDGGVTRDVYLHTLRGPASAAMATAAALVPKSGRETR